ncbi:MAG: thiamine phosphate synthase [Nitrospirota bacterium]
MKTYSSKAEAAHRIAERAPQLLRTKNTPLDFRLYLITNRKLFSAQCSMYFALETALEAGVRCIQLRERDLSGRELLDMAVWIRDLTREYRARLFINDRVDIALSVDADGVHLGQHSMPVRAARKIAGDRLLIGVSTHRIDEAEGAERDGADFITFGPVFKTASKEKYGKPLGTEIISEIKSRTSLPVFAIGGITPDRAEEVRDAGADGIALISAILTSADIRKTTKEFLKVLK